MKAESSESPTAGQTQVFKPQVVQVQFTSHAARHFIVGENRGNVKLNNL